MPNSIVIDGGLSLSTAARTTSFCCVIVDISLVTIKDIVMYADDELGLLGRYQHSYYCKYGFASLERA